MATISASFTAVGNGSSFSVRVGDKFTYAVSGTFVATVVLEKSETAGQSWATVVNTATAADSGTLTAEGKTKKAHVLYRYRCSAYTSGTAVCALADATQTIQEFKDQNGTVIFRLTEAGAEVPGTLGVTGAATVGGTLGVTGAATLGGDVTTSGVGAKNGATVTAVEYGGQGVHKTVLTLASTPATCVSVTTGAGVGGYKLYDFPEGYVRILGCVADLSLAIGAAKQADYTDNTPEGDIGIGTVLPANADALGTDATDDDFATAAAFTMTTFAATATCAPEAALNMDGTTTAKDLNVNILVDAGDIDDDTTSEVEVSGTVTVTWMNLGDY